jgi:hypothetical protein
LNAEGITRLLIVERRTLTRRRYSAQVSTPSRDHPFTRLYLSSVSEREHMGKQRDSRRTSARDRSGNPAAALGEGLQRRARPWRLLPPGMRPGTFEISRRPTARVQAHWCEKVLCGVPAPSVAALPVDLVAEKYFHGKGGYTPAGKVKQTA